MASSSTSAADVRFDKLHGNASSGSEDDLPMLPVSSTTDMSSLLNRSTPNPSDTPRATSSSIASPARFRESHKAASHAASVVPITPSTLLEDGVVLDGPEALVVDADVSAVVAHVAFALSDVVCVFGTPEDAQLLSSWSTRGGVNAFNQRTVTKLLQTRSGAGGVLSGLASAGLLPTAIVSSTDALLHMLEALTGLKEARLPAVLHVCTRSVSEAGWSVPAMDRLLAAAHARGITVLISSSPQEAHDASAAAHVTALETGAPVIHAYEDVGVSDILASTRVLRVADLARALPQNALALHRARGSKSVSAALPAPVAAAGALRVQPLPVTTTGGSDAHTIVVGVGRVAATAATISANTVRVVRVHTLDAAVVEHILAQLAGAPSHVAVLAGEEDSVLKSILSAAMDARGMKATLHTLRVRNDAHARAVLTALAQADAAGAAHILASHDAITSIVAASGAHGASSVTRISIHAPVAPASILLASAAHAVSAKRPGVAASLQQVQRYSNAASIATLQAHVSSSAYAHTDAELLAAGALGDDIVLLSHACLLAHTDALSHAIAALKPRGKLIITVDETALTLSPTHVAALTALRASVYTLAATSVAERFNLTGDAVVLPQLVALFAVTGAASFMHTAKTLETHIRSILPPEKHALIARLFAGAKQGMTLVNLASFATVDASSTTSSAPAELHALSSLALFVAQPRDAFEVTLGPTEWRSSAPTATAPTVNVDAQREYLRASMDRAIRSILFPFAHDSVLVPRADGVPAVIQPLQAATPTSSAPPASEAEASHEHQHETLFTPIVSVNKRLTPLDYDRNVFHVEMDISATSMRYSIGSALAVYAANPDEDVREFMNFYGVPVGAVAALPRPSDDDGDSNIATLQSVFRIFKREVDLFGRPSKDFYEALARHAVLPSEREVLALIASDAGTDEFTARATEGYTHADVLREFPSAHPSLDALFRMLPRIKPRHYSIASSQRMHATSVHLLVVEVAWTTPGGRSRYGQCSHYLANVRPGERITVAVIPSEMHLPRDPLAPVIMAGLGTGMAPFRAFIQERAALHAAGQAVGPMVLYFGARHRSKEYLYGEELDRYAADGIITEGGLRLAFSRDGTQKLYIQHLMAADSAMLWKLLQVREGSFYLCGPTWPEPDVEAAVNSAFVSHGGMLPEAATALITRLKADKRYVLEVY